jgi:hypothetical protein
MILSSKFSVIIRIIKEIYIKISLFCFFCSRILKFGIEYKVIVVKSGAKWSNGG